MDHTARSLERGTLASRSTEKMLVLETLHKWLGLNVEPRDLTFAQISLRGAIVFIVALIMLRVADRRFLAKLSAFDALLGFVLASMLARAINGSASFFPTLAGGFILVGLHRLLGWVAFRYPPFEKLIKGSASTLVRGGKPVAAAMKSNQISRSDLMEEMRLNGEVGDLNEVKTATLERNGEISVIPQK